MKCNSKLLSDILIPRDEMFWNYSHTFCGIKGSGFFLYEKDFFYQISFIKLSPSLFQFSKSIFTLKFKILSFPFMKG